MKNKIELRKTLICILCVITLAVAIFGAIYVYQYKIYTNNFNNKIAMIITKLTEEYPNLSESELFEIINNQGNINEKLFNAYGIDLNEDAVVIENERIFSKFLICNIICIVFICIIILLLFLRYNKSKDKKLNEIIKYIEEINNKNYKLDIDDNSEDELSILKNEIYKTTIMLKEIAENSKQDKIKLKDSLSDISHQLKTPLTSITILIDNIIDNPEMDKETKTEFAKDIKREITNINFLVQALLKLSKLDANSVKFINEDVTVESIITESMKNVAVLSDLRNVKIQVNGDKNAKVNCDFKWQVEAITNILKNAIEHSDTNGNIQINYEENQVYTKIEIIDYGVGIDKEDLPHIFERFYKGKNSSPESVGIGLALSKSIIENNNGYISVEAEQGTKFVIKYLK
ncbi:MAG: HAMP domain-containing histidine kinase [Clostridia bacterium]|nr:HAMP domain-containing histidine kinase [Clostridia bacterium]